MLSRPPSLTGCTRIQVSIGISNRQITECFDCEVLFLRDVCISAAYAIVRSLSVCLLSATFVYCVETSEHIIKTV